MSDISKKFYPNLLTPKKVSTTQAKPSSTNKSQSYKGKNTNNNIQNSQKTQYIVGRSLLHKIVEAEVVSNQEEYQNLLIRNKQLELKMLSLEQQAAQCNKSFRKMHQPLIDLKEKVQKARNNLAEKQKYLEKFYVHLDSKLKSNKNSHLFAKLGKIEKALTQKYEDQSNELYATLENQQRSAVDAEQQLSRLRQYRDGLIKQYTEKMIKNSQNRFKEQSQDTPSNSNSKNHKYSLNSGKNSSTQSKKTQLNIVQKRKEQKLKEKKQIEQECKQLRENIRKLKKEKETLEKDEKLLKVLLNVDEEHKKYSGYVLNGYRKMFGIKYREKLITEQKATSRMSLPLPTPEPDLQSIVKLITQKREERQVLKQEIQEKNNNLEKTRQKLNEQLNQYSQLQQRIMQSRNSYKQNRQSQIIPENRQSSYGLNRMSQLNSGYHGNQGTNTAEDEYQN